MIDCFDSIIGFTRTECDCFDSINDLGAMAKKSTSGLYMDELEESSHILKAMKSVADCGRTMGDLFKAARRNAVSSFKEQVMKELGTRFTVKQLPYSGLVGQTGNTGPLDSTSNWIGAAYEMRPLKGGVVKVNRIYLAINQAVPVDILVYKAYQIGGEYELQGDALATITVNALANVTTEKLLDDPLLLPMADDSAYVLHYLFLMNRSTSGFQAMDNKATCGCNNQYLLERWLMQGGIEGMDRDHLQTAMRRSGPQSYINGIVLETEIGCEDTGFVCDSYRSNPFIRKAIQYAILYEAVSSVLEGILRSDVINRFTLSRRDQMKTDSVILHNKFKSRVEWVAENIDMGPNNCFVCNTVNETGPWKAGITF